MLLAAVDHWNALAEGQPAHLRTVLQTLLRGSHVAAFVSAGTNVWLSAHGMHPPGHIVSKPFQWSEVSSHGRTYLAIHHSEMDGTNAPASVHGPGLGDAAAGRRSHALRADMGLRLPDQLGLCATSGSARPVSTGIASRFRWPEFRSNTRLGASVVSRLPQAPIEILAAATESVRDEQDRLRTGITTRRPRPDEETRDAE